MSGFTGRKVVAAYRGLLLLAPLLLSLLGAAPASADTPLPVTILTHKQLGASNPGTFTASGVFNDSGTVTTDAFVVTAAPSPHIRGSSHHADAARSRRRRQREDGDQGQPHEPRGHRDRGWQLAGPLRHGRLRDAAGRRRRNGDRGREPKASCAHADGNRKPLAGEAQGPRQDSGCSGQRLLRRTPRARSPPRPAREARRELARMAQ